MMPRQLGPISRIPYFCAARSAASASDPAPWPRPALTIKRRRAPLSCLIDEANDRGCRRSNDHEFGHERQFAETVDRHNAVDLGIMGIHQPKIAFEFRLVNIPENGSPDGPLARTRPDQRDRMGRKQIFQTIGRHQFNCPLCRPGYFKS